VGDTADDMVLGRTAGCALSVGVLGGASDLAELSAHADFLVPCVTNVIKLLYQYRHQAAAL
jgi:phosphoglycolate phosphatase-like HAD superfamily hydrolase